MLHLLFGVHRRRSTPALWPKVGPRHHETPTTRRNATQRPPWPGTNQCWPRSGRPTGHHPSSHRHSDVAGPTPRSPAGRIRAGPGSPGDSVHHSAIVLTSRNQGDPSSLELVPTRTPVEPWLRISASTTLIALARPVVHHNCGRMPRHSTAASLNSHSEIGDRERLLTTWIEFVFNRHERRIRVDAYVEDVEREVRRSRCMKLTSNTSRTYSLHSFSGKSAKTLTVQPPGRRS